MFQARGSIVGSPLSAPEVITRIDLTRKKKTDGPEGDSDLLIELHFEGNTVHVTLMLSL